MTTAEPPVPESSNAGPPPALDDMMLAMDVVDTLRHRERLVERELNADAREDELVERLRDLYKSQGIEVPDSVLAEGVKALKEDRFVYSPPKESFERTLATIWVKRATYGKWAAAVLVGLILIIGVYHFTIVKPREQAAEAARVELSETLPRDLAAAYSAIVAEAQVPAARERADAILAQGRSALEREDAAAARAAVADLDGLAKALQQEYVLRIAGRPEDDTGFFREHPSFQGRAYFLVVDAVDQNGDPVTLPVRNDETNETETVSRFAVRVPIETFDAVRNDKATNGVVQNTRLAEKRRGYLEPEFLMPTLPGRITSW
jgi:Family of unknown function (DUF6384)